MFVFGVVMGDDHRLMLAEPEFLDEPVGNIAHGLGRQPLGIGGRP